MTKEEILQKVTFDLETRGRSIETIKEYTSKTRLYQDYYDKPADEMGEKEIIEYLHYLLTEKKIHSNSVNTYNSALRFFNQWYESFDANKHTGDMASHDAYFSAARDDINSHDRVT